MGQREEPDRDQDRGQVRMSDIHAGGLGDWWSCFLDRVCTGGDRLKQVR